MMNTNLLHNVLRQFQARFRACFSALTEQDLHTILTGPSELLLDVLAQRYGYTRTEAKAAWNEFVLRYVDGHDAGQQRGLGHRGTQVSRCGLRGRRKQGYQWQQRQRKLLCTNDANRLRTAIMSTRYKRSRA